MELNAFTNEAIIPNEMSQEDLNRLDKEVCVYLHSSEQFLFFVISFYAATRGKGDCDAEAH